MIRLRWLLAACISLLLAAPVGCGPAKNGSPPPGNGGTGAGGHGHEHPPHGPNGGHLISLADGRIQAEWLYEDAGLVTVHLLDAAGEKPLESLEVQGVRIEVLLGDQALPAFTLASRTEDPTVYEISDESLVVHLTGEGDGVLNTLVVTVDGADHKGKIIHHAH